MHAELMETILSYFKSKSLNFGFNINPYYFYKFIKKIKICKIFKHFICFGAYGT